MARQRDLTKSQLFLDDTWVEDAQRMVRLWHKADIFPEPVLRPEKPWEGAEVLLYGTVFRLGNKWRMYYIGRSGGWPAVSVLCVAESDDGLRWHRPVVGVVEFHGSKENNIVYQPINSPSVCYDPEDGDAPFKLIFHGSRTPDGPAGIQGAVSKDGLHWSPLPRPLLAPTGDHKYIMFNKVHGKYVVFLRRRNMRDDYGTRCVFISESEDFRTFSEPELILKPDLIDPPDVEFYMMAGYPYADMYLGLIERYHGVPDMIDMTLAWSYDLRNWHRPVSREAFIGPEYPWNRLWSSNNSAPPIQVGNQLWFYFGGRSGAHFHIKNGPPKYAAIGMATITVDRFASLSAGFRQGRVVTKPMVWPGGDLLLNASTTRNLDGYPLDGGGEMQVEVWDEGERPIDGFSGDCRTRFEGNVPTRKDTSPAVLRWPKDRSLNELAGRRIRLVFYMRDSHLYSFSSSG